MEYQLEIRGKMGQVANAPPGRYPLKEPLRGRLLIFPGIPFFASEAEVIPEAVDFRPPHKPAGALHSPGIPAEKFKAFSHQLDNLVIA